MPASAAGWSALSLDDKRLLLDLFTKSAADFLGQWFESEVVKGALAFDGIVGAYAEPLHAGHRLSAAALRLRRGQRQAGGVGPRRRRHGRHHPGHGARRRGAGGRHSHRRPGGLACSSRAAGPRAWSCRRASASRRGRSRPTCRPSCCSATWSRRAPSIPSLRRRFIGAEIGLRRLPHECGAVRAARLHLPARQGRAGPPRLRHRHRPDASTTWSAPISMRARTAGRGSRWWRC